MAQILSVSSVAESSYGQRPQTSGGTDELTHESTRKAAGAGDLQSAANMAGTDAGRRTLAMADKPASAVRANDFQRAAGRVVKAKQSGDVGGEEPG